MIPIKGVDLLKQYYKTKFWNFGIETNGFEDKKFYYYKSQLFLSLKALHSF